MADAWHHRSDALSSVGSFVGILGARMGFPMLDPLASVVICLFVVKAAVDIFRDAIIIENWRLKFLEMDQEKLTRKFHLEADEEALYIVYFSRKLRIDRKSGVITDQGVHPGFDTVMNIYNTFYYASEHPVASGNLVAFRQVKRML